MVSLILNALIASVVLTALINVIPRLFPGSSAEDRIRDLVGEERSAQSPPHPHDSDADPERPPFRVWFPWRSMLMGSIILTIVVNLIAFFS